MDFFDALLTITIDGSVGIGRDYGGKDKFSFHPVKWTYF